MNLKLCGKGIKESFRISLPFSVYLFAIALLLAYFEVQIEGPNGWAGILPTWRLTNPNITWIFGGRPVTGYHVSLNLLLLSFFHWPLLFNKWSLVFEAKTLSCFALLATVWDFLWFIINPNFGLGKYNSANIWWFKTWLLGIPIDYYLGIFMAVAFRCIPGLFKKENIRQSLTEAVSFVILVLLLTLIFTYIISKFQIIK
jgi:hypothetical protein